VQLIDSLYSGKYEDTKVGVVTRLIFFFFLRPFQIAKKS